MIFATQTKSCSWSCWIRTGVSRRTLRFSILKTGKNISIVTTVLRESSNEWKCKTIPWLPGWWTRHRKCLLSRNVSRSSRKLRGSRKGAGNYQLFSCINKSTGRSSPKGTCSRKVKLKAGSSPPGSRIWDYRIAAVLGKRRNSFFLRTCLVMTWKFGKRLKSTKWLKRLKTKKSGKRLKTRTRHKGSDSYR